VDGRSIGLFDSEDQAVKAVYEKAATIAESD
jgi:hypothetical protein